MRIKKKILIYALFMLVIFATIFTVPESYAYWNTVALTNTKSQSATIGQWVDTWTSTASYNVNDIVYFNGSYWISLKASNANKEPTLSKPGSNWWAPYTF